MTFCPVYKSGTCAYTNFDNLLNLVDKCFQFYVYPLYGDVAGQFDTWKIIRKVPYSTNLEIVFSSKERTVLFLKLLFGVETRENLIL